MTREEERTRTEEIIRDIAKANFKKVEPIVQQMTELIVSTYEKGFFDGLEMGLHRLTIKKPCE